MKKTLVILVSFFLLAISGGMVQAEECSVPFPERTEKWQEPILASLNIESLGVTVHALIFRVSTPLESSSEDSEDFYYSETMLFVFHPQAEEGQSSELWFAMYTALKAPDASGDGEKSASERVQEVVIFEPAEDDRIKCVFQGSGAGSGEFLQERYGLTSK